jgi:hypothetical protein
MAIFNSYFDITRGYFWLVKSSPFYPWPPISVGQGCVMAVQLRQVNGEAVGGALSIAMAMLRTHFVIDGMMGYVSIYLSI